MISSRYALCIFVLQVGADSGSKIAGDDSAFIGAHLLDEARQLAVITNVVSKAPEQPDNIPVSLIDAFGITTHTERETPVINAAPAVNANKTPPYSSLPDSVSEKKHPSITDDQRGTSNAILVEDEEEDQLARAQSVSLKTEHDDKAASQLDSSKGGEYTVATGTVSSQGPSAIQGYDADDGDGDAAHRQVSLMLKHGGDSAPATSSAPTINSIQQTSNDDRTASPSFVSVHHRIFSADNNWVMGIACFLTLILLTFAAIMVHDDE
eukprot:GEMP01052104.1.p1 GENE.GEMP01052104.1~~GEMP01052104.1.p1  ORF type:complete len:266 (+),score=45.70 GEMP01052104.1:72-869(+)